MKNAKSLPPGWRLMDLELLSIKHAATLEIPCWHCRHNVPVGALVKIFLKPDSGPSERFWAEVLSRTEGGYRGRVANRTLFDHGFKFGDVIQFGFEHIMDIDDVNNEMPEHDDDQ